MSKEWLSEAHVTERIKLDKQKWNKRKHEKQIFGRQKNIFFNKFN